MRALVCVWLALLSTSARDIAQRDPSTEAYLELVVRYASGERPATTAELARWPLNDLQKALRDLRVVLPIVSRRLDLSEVTLVATAMAFHVDVARRADTLATAEAFLVLGGKLAELLPESDDVLRFGGRWHHAAGTTMFGFSRTAEALGHFEVARALLPKDASILLALGSAHEIEGVVEARHRATAPASANERLRKAAQLYAAALAIQPDLDEARVRLARTQWLLQEPKTAAQTIGDLPDRVSSAYLRYIGLLIAGGIQEALGRRDEGLARYEQAATMCRRCPAVMLALSHARLVDGKRDAARDIVARLVTDDLWPPADDPWWAYQQGQWHAIDTLVEHLRQAVPK